MIVCRAPCERGIGRQAKGGQRALRIVQAQPGASGGARPPDWRKVHEIVENADPMATRTPMRQPPRQLGLS